MQVLRPCRNFFYKTNTQGSMLKVNFEIRLTLSDSYIRIMAKKSQCKFNYLIVSIEVKPRQDIQDLINLGGGI